MELIWYYVDKDIAHKYHEAHIDFGVESTSSKSIFYEAPFALGMEALSEQKTGDSLFPYPDKGKGEDDTSLALGSRGIINPLFQYTEYADPRTAGKSGRNFGRVYNNKIRPNNPIVFLQPGRPKFLGVDKFFLGGDADGIRASIANKMTDAESSPFSLTDLVDALAGDVSNPQRFYDFDPDFNSFRVYVRAIMDELKIRMGLDNVYQKHWVGPIDSNEDIFTKFMEYYGFLETAAALQSSGNTKPIQSAFLPFRVEKSTDASDSFNNTTGQSSAANTIRGETDKAKEVLFLTGTGDNVSGKMDSVAKAASSVVQGLVGSAVGTAASSAETVIKTGGNMLFPEIWKDSAYSKSLTITMKCHAPYGNKMCMYENILFPVACCLALAMPKQSDNSVYISPPLIRGYSKGWFSIDMGMVESFSLKRGNDRNDWTVEGLPRTVEISLTIKDLFGAIMMSLGGNAKANVKIFHKRNTALRDYLNVIGGIDTFADASFSQTIKNRWASVVNGWQQAIDPKMVVNNLLSNPIIGGPVRFATKFFI